MAIKNSVSNDVLSTFVDSINVFDCHLSGVHMGAVGSASLVNLVHVVFL